MRDGGVLAVRLFNVKIRRGPDRRMYTSKSSVTSGNDTLKNWRLVVCWASLRPFPGTLGRVVSRCDNLSTCGVTSVGLHSLVSRWYGEVFLLLRIFSTFSCLGINLSTDSHFTRMAPTSRLVPINPLSY